MSDNIPATVHCLNLVPYVTGFLFKHTTGVASLLASLAPSCQRTVVLSLSGLRGKLLYRIVRLFNLRC